MLLIRNENLIRHVALICKCNTCRYMYIRKIKVGWGLKWSCVCPPCSDSVDLLVCCLCDHAPDTIAHLRATTPVYIIHVLPMAAASSGVEATALCRTVTIRDQ